MLLKMGLQARYSPSLSPHFLSHDFPPPPNHIKYPLFQDEPPLRLHTDFLPFCGLPFVASPLPSFVRSDFSSSFLFLLGRTGRSFFLISLSDAFFCLRIPPSFQCIHIHPPFFLKMMDLSFFCNGYSSTFPRLQVVLPFPPPKLRYLRTSPPSLYRIPSTYAYWTRKTSHLPPPLPTLLVPLFSK